MVRLAVSGMTSGRKDSECGDSGVISVHGTLGATCARGGRRGRERGGQ